MSKTEAISSRIDSIQDMQSVVKTMKSLAAVKIRVYERAVESLGEYFATIEKGIQGALMNARVIPAGLSPGKRGGEGIIVFSSEQGMCGQFNDNLLSYIENELAGSGNDPGEITVLSIGERLTHRLTDLGLSIDREVGLSGSLGDITPLAEEIVLTMEQWQEEKNITTVHLYHNTPVSGTGAEPVKRKMFPLDVEWIESLIEKKWESRCIPIYRVPFDELFSSLVREHIFVMILRSCAESLAGENASRLSAMQSAEKNIDEKLDELNSEYQRERQSEITGELLDIVSGFEALTKHGE